MKSSILDLIIFINATVGFTYIVTKAAVFTWLRNYFNINDKKRSLREKRIVRKAGLKFPGQTPEYMRYIEIKKEDPLYFYLYAVIYKILTCPLCFGFWAGLATYYMQMWGWDPLLYAFIGSADAFFFYLIAEALYRYFEDK